MIQLQSNKEGKVDLVVGDFYVVNHDAENESHTHIIKNPEAYNSYAKTSESNKKTLDELEVLKRENPLSWGVYEDWQAAVDLNQWRITEAVARQYQALDYILAKSDEVDNSTALYMLKRIENSYKSFMELKGDNEDGVLSAHAYLDAIRLKGDAEPRQKVYFYRLLDRINSGIRPCPDFFNEASPEKYVRKLTQPQGFLKPSRLTVNHLTFNDVLREYLLDINK